MMENTSILKVIESMAEDILTLAHWVMDKQGLKGSRLDEELFYTVESSANPVIQLFFNDYISYVESGKKSHSTPPPISALRDWALRKGIAVDNSTLFAIAQAIARNGIAPRPIFALLEDEMEKRFETEWTDQLFEIIVEELKSFFLK